MRESDLLIEIVVWGGLVPAATAVAIMASARRLLSEQVSARYAAAVAFAVALFIGNALSPSGAPLKPDRGWQWLPYLSGLAILVPAAPGKGLYLGVRWLMFFLAATLTAWLVVPDWPDLRPSTTFYIFALGGGLGLLCVLLDPLPARINGSLFVGLLSIVSAAAAVMLAVCLSLNYGQFCGVITASMVGCGIGTFFYRDNEVARGLIPAFAITVGGLLFYGHIYPEVPLRAMLLIPAAPLALWISAAGPLARHRGVAAGAIQATAVLVPLIVAAMLLLSGELFSGESGGGSSGY